MMKKALRARLMSKAQYKERHGYLHKAFDELIADWIFATGNLPSRHSIMELIRWSAKQVKDPSKIGRF